MQGVEADLDFFERVYRTARGRRFERLREDFCGTAALACAWALRRGSHRAWGVDLDPEPIAWCRTHRLARLGRAARRVTLRRGDVRSVRQPPVDVVAAMNFSYWVFKTRNELRGYFAAARRSLRPGGILFVNAFGGTEAMAALEERRRIPASQGPDGLRIPAFTYVWEQASFNAIDHHLRCHIHFRLAGGRWMRRAFTYDWRMWTLPEIREVMLEAGFAESLAYVEGWDDDANRSGGYYRRRTRLDNQEGWLAIVAGLR